MALLPLLLAGLALAGDGRVGISVLPVLRQGEVPTTSATQLTETSQALLVEHPDFRLVPLGPKVRDHLLRDAPCRELAGCLEEWIPAEAELVLDPRLELREGLLALDLRLLRGGEVVGRHASAVSVREVSGAARRELPLLIAAWALEAQLP